MSTGTSIEWTDNSWSPITGCTRHSAGCDHCYSARMTYRLEKMGQEKYRGLTVLNKAGDRHFNGVVKCHDDELVKPLSWKKPRRIFVNSMSDTFHRDVPFEFIDKIIAIMALCPQHTFQILTKRPERMAEYFASFNADLIDEDRDASGTDIGHRLSAAAGTLLDGTWIWGPGKQYRQRIEDFISDCIGELDAFDEDNPDREFKPIIWPLPNVWLGTSVEDQQRADERIPHLLKCPATVRFLSIEPLLGSIDPKRWMPSRRPAKRPDGTPFLAANFYITQCDCCEWLGSSELCGGGEDEVICPKCKSEIPGTEISGEIHWVIVGGESGPGARPMNVQWARDILTQCKRAGVACFVKQLGSQPIAEYGTDYTKLICNHHGQSAYTIEHKAWPKGPDEPLGSLPLIRSDGRAVLSDRKGGDMSEWPEDLRVREFPELPHA